MLKYVFAFFAFILVTLAPVYADEGYIPFWPDFLEPNGITLRYGVNRHFDEFGTTNCASLKFQTKKCTYNPYLKSNNSINSIETGGFSGDSFRFPVTFEFPETLMSQQFFRKWYVEMDGAEIYDLPPQTDQSKEDHRYAAGEDKYYRRQDSGIRSRLKEEFFTASELDLINNNSSYSNWALSADYIRNTYGLGYMVGFFIPRGNYIRWLTLSAGLGVGHLEIQMNINLCQSYLATADGTNTETATGKCIGKTQIEKASLSETRMYILYSMMPFEFRTSSHIIRIFNWELRNVFSGFTRTEGHSGEENYPKLKLKNRSRNWEYKTRKFDIDILSYTYVFR